MRAGGEPGRVDTRSGDLVERVALLGRALREVGVRVAVGDQVDALAALLLVDLGDQGEVRRALRIALKIRPPDAEAFEEAFARLFLGVGVGQPQPGHPPLESRPAPPRPGRPGAGLPLLAAALEREREVEVPVAEEPGESPLARLKRKHFERCDERDLARMEPLLLRLARQLATRRGRRLRPSPRPGIVDLRRSLRRAHGTGGELVSLAWRDRPRELPRLVFLCDTSGSMEGHTRFLLAFARALRRVAAGTEVFAFNTALTRITPWLAAARQEVVLSRLAEAVPDWSGGTRIGECLGAFCERHLDALVDSRSVVLVFSDGLDRGDPDGLGRAMRRIAARARRVIWLNPLLSDPRFEPAARGMAAALPHIDLLAPAHDLRSLERLLPALRL